MIDLNEDLKDSYDAYADFFVDESIVCLKIFFFDLFRKIDFL
jgi:hypothetical protein